MAPPFSTDYRQLLGPASTSIRQFVTVSRFLSTSPIPISSISRARSVECASVYICKLRVDC